FVLELLVDDPVAFLEGEYDPVLEDFGESADALVERQPYHIGLHELGVGIVENDGNTGAHLVAHDSGNVLVHVLHVPGGERGDEIAALGEIDVEMRSPEVGPFELVVLNLVLAEGLGLGRNRPARGRQNDENPGRQQLNAQSLPRECGLPPSPPIGRRSNRPGRLRARFRRIRRGCASKAAPARRTRRTDNRKSTGTPIRAPAPCWAGRPAPWKARSRWGWRRPLPSRRRAIRATPSGRRK